MNLVTKEDDFDLHLTRRFTDVRKRLFAVRSKSHLPGAVPGRDHLSQLFEHRRVVIHKQDALHSVLPRPGSRASCDGRNGLSWPARICPASAKKNICGRHTAASRRGHTSWMTGIYSERRAGRPHPRRSESCVGGFPGTTAIATDPGTTSIIGLDTFCGCALGRSVSDESGPPRLPESLEVQRGLHRLITENTQEARSSRRSPVL